MLMKTGPLTISIKIQLVISAGSIALLMPGDKYSMQTQIEILVLLFNEVQLKVAHEYDQGKDIRRFFG